MVSSIERELKTLLSKAEYDKLYTYFNLQGIQPKIIQSNYYYDTADEIFKQNNASARGLRVFDNGSSEWTIKERVSELESIENLLNSIERKLMRRATIIE